MEVTAREFIRQLEALKSPEDVERVARFFKEGEDHGAGDNKIMGVFIGKKGALRPLSEAPRSNKQLGSGG